MFNSLATAEGRKKLWKTIFTDYKYIFSFILLIIVFTIASPKFLSYTGVSTLIMQSTIKGMLALGMTIIIISGMIDLSVGSNIAFTGGLGIVLLNATWNPWLMLVFCIVCATLLNIICGLLITKGNIAPFIVTLAMMSIERSIIVQLGQGGPFIIDSGILVTFREVAAGSTLGVPNLMLILIAAAVAMWIITSKTRFGRYIYAIGSNPMASRLSGVNVDRTKVQIFGLHGIFVGITSFLFASRMTSITAANAGMSYELDAIAAVAIGGTAMTGGRGMMLGTFLGALMIQMIEGILIAWKISPFLTGFVKGIIILVAVLMQTRRDTTK